MIPPAQILRSPVYTAYLTNGKKLTGKLLFNENIYYLWDGKRMHTFQPGDIRKLEKNEDAAILFKRSSVINITAILLFLAAVSSLAGEKKTSDERDELDYKIESLQKENELLLHQLMETEMQLRRIPGLENSLEKPGQGRRSQS